MSVYLNNIPQASDRLSVSQGQFLVNFGQLNTQFGIDHVPFNNSGSNGSGFHKQVTLAADVASPSITGAVGSVHANTFNSNHELFYMNAVRDMQVTSSSFKTYTPTKTGTATFTGLSAISGYSSVIGGVTFFSVQFSFTSTSVGTVILTLPTECLSTGGQANFSSINTSGLTITVGGQAGSGIVPIIATATTVTAATLTAGLAGNFYLNGFYI